MAVSAQSFANVAGTPATPQFAEIVIKGHSVESTGLSKPFNNILHFVRATGTGGHPVEDLSQAVIDQLEPSLSAALSVAYVADFIEGRYMDDPTFMPVPIANPIVGAISGDRLPNFNAVVTRKKTYQRGRSYRGSNHWGPVAESDTTLDNLNAGAITRWTDVKIAIEGLGIAGVDVAGNQWHLFVLSPTLSSLSLNPALFTGSRVGQALLNTHIGTMRRRKEKGVASV